MSKTCCMFNYGPRYRNAIYSKIDKELKYDLYFGHTVPGSINKIDVSTYENYQRDLKNVFIKNLYWQRGAIQNVFKSYSNFIMDGELSGLSTWVVMILAKLTGKKVYLWSHGWYERDGRVKSFFRKFFFSISHKVLLYGDYAKQIMMRHGFKDDKLKLIYNSLDYDTQKKVRDKLIYTDVFIGRFGNNYPTLCYVGRIQKWKRLDLLIDAMVQLKNENFPLNLVVIGEDDEDTGLENYINKNNLSENVWLYGPTYNEDEIGELIFNSSICVSPGNVGLTAIHSLMYGTPVITHNDYGYQGPEFEAIQEGVTGGFFERNDTCDLAKSIRNWLIKHPEKKMNLINDCHKIIDERYNPYYQIEVLRKVIDDDF